MNPSARIFAGVIAATAWTGLVWQLALSTTASGAIWRAVWIMVEYFTILTNLLVAVVFTCVALGVTSLGGGPLQQERVIAGTMLSILLVGVVYLLLLRGTLDLQGGALIVDKLMHYVVPALTVVFWAVCTPEGALTWRDPLVWAVYPLLYLAYGMTRGLMTARYPYPFLNVAELGWQRTALNASVIAMAFVIAGYVVVGIDGWLG